MFVLRRIEAIRENFWIVCCICSAHSLSTINAPYGGRRAHSLLRNRLLKARYSVGANLKKFSQIGYR